MEQLTWILWLILGVILIIAEVYARFRAFLVRDRGGRGRVGWVSWVRVWMAVRGFCSGFDRVDSYVADDLCPPFLCTTVTR